MILTSNDCLITLIYFAFVLAIGLRPAARAKTGLEYFEAGKALSAPLCGAAFLMAGLGTPELIGLSAAGARYGFTAARMVWLGAIPAILFVALFMMPFYYGSQARSVPEFLGIRFDRKTRALSAGLFALLSLLSSAVGLYMMGRIIAALHIFDGLFRSMGWPLADILILSMVAPAVVVVFYTALGGLRGAVYSQALQLAALMAGMAPVVFKGLGEIGGWSGLKASLHVASPGFAPAPAGAGFVAMSLGFGLILGFGVWCSDFRVLQIALVAKNAAAARRAPLIAAVLALLVPLLLVLPGMVAIGLPTPRNTTITRVENGSIYSSTTVVRPEAAAGDGLIPAQMDETANKPRRDAHGHTLLNYAMALPSLLLQALPNGLLGLGLTALLASLMSGLAANTMAFSAVFTRDLYAVGMRREVGEAHLVTVGRVAALGSVLLALGAACAALRLAHLPDLLLLVVTAVDVPLFVAAALAIFWKRATGHGAFAGLAAGAGAAVLHHGCTLAASAQRGLQGGWIAPVYTYSGVIAQACATAVCALAAAFLAGALVSLATKAREEAELRGILLATRRGPRWKRPAALAAAVLVVAAGLAILFP